MARRRRRCVGCRRGGPSGPGPTCPALVDGCGIRDGLPVLWLEARPGFQLGEADAVDAASLDVPGVTPAADDALVAGVEIVSYRFDAARGELVRGRAGGRGLAVAGHVAAFAVELWGDGNPPARASIPAGGRDLRHARRRAPAPRSLGGAGGAVDPARRRPPGGRAVVRHGAVPVRRRHVPSAPRPRSTAARGGRRRRARPASGARRAGRRRGHRRRAAGAARAGDEARGRAWAGRPARRGQRGAALIGAVLLAAALAILAGAVGWFALVASQTTAAARDHADVVAAAQAGLEIAAGALAREPDIAAVRLGLAVAPGGHASLATPDGAIDVPLLTRRLEARRRRLPPPADVAVWRALPVGPPRRARIRGSRSGRARSAGRRVGARRRRRGRRRRSARARRRSRRAVRGARRRGGGNPARTARRRDPRRLAGCRHRRSRLTGAADVGRRHVTAASCTARYAAALFAGIAGHRRRRPGRREPITGRWGVCSDRRRSPRFRPTPRAQRHGRRRRCPSCRRVYEARDR